ncbi:MAG TPA: phosphatase PAP2 family protein [Abditibacterium sp.]
MNFFPIGDFAREFFAALPQILPRLLLAWVASFLIINGALLALKNRVRPRILRLDSHIRAWARTLRYQDVTASGPGAAERHARTYFFRFWTNFASAPALIAFSLLVAIGAARFEQPRMWYLPGLCYAGSMLLSFVSKRVFNRLRPEREAGAFGHKLRDGSFPSGHSLTSFCFWFMLAATAAIVGISLSWIGILVAAAIGIVTLTGLSRIYLGVHFPSDVLGGFSMGLIWCAVCYFVLRPAL